MPVRYCVDFQPDLFRCKIRKIRGRFITTKNIHKYPPGTVRLGGFSPEDLSEELFCFQKEDCFKTMKEAKEIMENKAEHFYERVKRDVAWILSRYPNLDTEPKPYASIVWR